MNKTLDVIESQSNLIAYCKENFTAKYKVKIYQAFTNVYKKYPDEMEKYLMESSRKGGFQNKLFQEYVSLIEAELPFSIRKNKKIKNIDSLLDEDLNIFDGISEFTGKLNSKLELENGTKEMYVGGRKATYAQPFYIGKILSAKNKNDECIKDKIKSYSFTKIKFFDLKESAQITIKHLRVVPHYQMGVMTHINRIRKSIVDELKQTI